MRTLLLLPFLLLAWADVTAAQEKPLVVEVWPGRAPGETGKVGPEKVTEPKKDDKHLVTRITDVSKPTLTVFRPAKDKDTGAAVVIAPGGGYSILAWDLEGEEVAAWERHCDDDQRMIFSRFE